MSNPVIAVAPSPAKTKSKSSKPAKFARGKLYFNKGTRQVERAVEVQGLMVWTARHRQKAEPYASSNFVLATDEQVAAYLAEGKTE